jgi:hypothetical protein
VELAPTWFSCSPWARHDGGESFAPHAGHGQMAQGVQMRFGVAESLPDMARGMGYGSGQAAVATRWLHLRVFDERASCAGLVGDGGALGWKL